MLLAQSAGLGDLTQRLMGVASANAAAKTTALVAGMLTGADSIDDLGVLRHGGMSRLFTGVRAPSTLGTFLRSFTHGHVQQLNFRSAKGGQFSAGVDTAHGDHEAGGGPFSVTDLGGRGRNITALRGEGIARATRISASLRFSGRP